MKQLLLCLALYVFGIHAIPKPLIRHDAVHSRIRYGTRIIPDAVPHACMVLVHRQSLEGTNTAALGGGSIISNRHVVTAAHLVQGTNIRYQIGFFVGVTRRMVESVFRLMHEDYDNTDFNNDIALLFLQGTATFPLVNVISISTNIEAPREGDRSYVVSFGFTHPNSTGPTSYPYFADQTVAADCQFNNFEAADTHFCAEDEQDFQIICPGDNGAGLYAEDLDARKTLIGIVSRILPGCSQTQLTAYTRVSLFVAWITNITGIPVSTFVENYNKLHK